MAMKTDCLVELQSLRDKVEGKIALSGLGLGISRPEKELSNLSEFGDSLLASDLPERLAYELRGELVEADDKRQVFEFYRDEVAKRVIDEDKASKGIKRQAAEYGLKEPILGQFLHQIGMLLMSYREGVIEPILSDLDTIEKEYLGGAKREPLMVITPEALKEFKAYFTSTFKGMGDNPDRFNEYLKPALEQVAKLTKKDIAILAKACYNSRDMRSDTRPKSWNKWKDVWCMLFSIDGLPYKQSELPEPEYGIGNTFHYLNPPYK